MRARRWLAGGLTAKGRVEIDAGAARALQGGASLLAAGVTAVSGSFARGDILDIAGPDGRVIARGLSEYPGADAANILGLGRDAQEAALGYAPRSAVVHRDHSWCSCDAAHPRDDGSDRIRGRRDDARCSSSGLEGSRPDTPTAARTRRRHVDRGRARRRGEPRRDGGGGRCRHAHCGCRERPDPRRLRGRQRNRDRRRRRRRPQCRSGALHPRLVARGARTCAIQFMAGRKSAPKPSSGQAGSTGRSCAPRRSSAPAIPRCSTSSAWRSVVSRWYPPAACRRSMSTNSRGCSSRSPPIAAPASARFTSPTTASPLAGRTAASPARLRRPLAGNACRRSPLPPRCSRRPGSSTSSRAPQPRQADTRPRALYRASRLGRDRRRRPARGPLASRTRHRRRARRNSALVSPRGLALTSPVRRHRSPVEACIAKGEPHPLEFSTHDRNHRQHA